MIVWKLLVPWLLVSNFSHFWPHIFATPSVLLHYPWTSRVTNGNVFGIVSCGMPSPAFRIAVIRLTLLPTIGIASISENDVLTHVLQLHRWYFSNESTYRKKLILFFSFCDRLHENGFAFILFRELQEEILFPQRPHFLVFHPLLGNDVQYPNFLDTWRWGISSHTCLPNFTEIRWEL